MEKPRRSDFKGALLHFEWRPPKLGTRLLSRFPKSILFNGGMVLWSHFKNELLQEGKREREKSSFQIHSFSLPLAPAFYLLLITGQMLRTLLGNCHWIQTELPDGPIIFAPEQDTILTILQNFLHWIIFLLFILIDRAVRWVLGYFAVFNGKNTCTLFNPSSKHSTSKSSNSKMSWICKPQIAPAEKEKGRRRRKREGKASVYRKKDGTNGNVPRFLFQQ